jgi:hypothetical protein
MESAVLEPSVRCERLSWKEICARHPDEWVTLTDFEWQDDDEDNGELVSAVLLGHGHKRGESLRATRELREREQITDVAEWFTGEWVRHPRG